MRGISARECQRASLKRWLAALTAAAAGLWATAPAVANDDDVLPQCRALQIPGAGRHRRNERGRRSQDGATGSDRPDGKLRIIRDRRSHPRKPLTIGHFEVGTARGLLFIKSLRLDSTGSAASSIASKSSLIFNKSNVKINII